jgi:dTDP-4-amino-4,6-dideoxygalactose transaminase
MDASTPGLCTAGAVVTANPKYAETIRLLRNWGESRRYYHDLRDFNYRMEGMQGALSDRTGLRGRAATRQRRNPPAADYRKPSARTSRCR